jgi:hypothetical protein
MKRYNLISLETGRIRKVISATGYDNAVQIASEMFNCYAEDCFIIELIQETEHQRTIQTRCWNLQTL